MGRRRTISGEIGNQELTSLLVQSKKVLKESLSLLQNEAEEMPEGKIANQAKENLVGLDDLLSSIALSSSMSPM